MIALGMGRGSRTPYADGTPLQRADMVLVSDNSKAE